MCDTGSSLTSLQSSENILTLLEYRPAAVPSLSQQTDIAGLLTKSFVKTFVHNFSLTRVLATIRKLPFVPSNEWLGGMKLGSNCWLNQRTHCKAYCQLLVTIKWTTSSKLVAVYDAPTKSSSSRYINTLPLLPALIPDKQNYTLSSLLKPLCLAGSSRRVLQLFRQL